MTKIKSTVIFESRLSRLFWIGLGIAALALGFLGWGVDQAIKHVQRQAVATNLETMLASSERTVTSWLDDRQQFSAVLVKTLRMQRLLGPLVVGQKGEPDILRALLREYVSPFKLHHGMVTDSQGRIVFADDPAIIGHALKTEALPALQRALKGEASITPMHMVDFGRGPTPAMLVMAPAAGIDRVPRGALVLAIEPAEFSALLDETQPGETGEAYAFDSSGRMISESRFIDQIVAAGVLPPGTKSTVLTMDLRNPGVNLISGQVSSLPPRQSQPLTEMVAAAVSGTAGVNPDGFQGYRGVWSVAAWRWIPRYDFGLAVTMAYNEAYSAHYVLRRIFMALIVLLVAVTLAMIVYSLLNAHKQRKLERAMSKAEKLGQYRLERKLGEGGMGEVYLGHHALLARPTAIKLMRDASKSEDKQRFEQEVRISSHLTHPNTIAIYDFGHTVEGIFYYAMEYLDGMDLATMVQRFGPLPSARVIHILSQVCGSLAEAHEQRLIHRDIKPENIMLCARGGVYDTVKVVDFGLVKSLDAKGSRLTAAATVMGTPAFMAPEAVTGAEIDGRCDLYALAAVGYFLLTGRLVFQKNSVMDTLMAQIQEDPVPPSRYEDIPADLELAIMHGLLKEPARRPADARAMRAELLACADAGKWTEQEAQLWWVEHAPSKGKDEGGSGPALPPMQIAT